MKKHNGLLFIANLISYFFMFSYTGAMAQIVSGNFPQAKNSSIKLKKFEGFSAQVIAQTTIDSLGNFTLQYPKEYVGAALIEVQQDVRLIVLLNHENFSLQWNNFKDFTTLIFKNSQENEQFTAGMLLNQAVEQKLAGLKYLATQYEQEEAKQKWLKDESDVQENLIKSFIHQLPTNYYCKNYLLCRKLIADMQLTRERYKTTDRILQHEKDFKAINLTDDYVWHSGLVKELLDGYYQVLELYNDKSIQTLKIMESNAIWLNTSMVKQGRKEELARVCYEQFERHNYTQASEQIALKMLSCSSCKLTREDTDRFEQYRKMAIGRKAPNIKVSSTLKLANLKANYKFVVFGSGECPQCKNDYPALLGIYNKLKEKYSLEIVYISIDRSSSEFESIAKNAPFITYCDGLGWDTTAVKEFHVFATPTYILVDKELSIVAKFNYPEQVEEWLNKLK